MSIPVYDDFITKYKTDELIERNPYRFFQQSEHYYDVKRSRYIDISEIFNSLYEEGLISYTRTDCPVMDINQFDERFKIFDAIGQSHFKNREIIQLLTRMDLNLMKPDCWIHNPPFSHRAITPTFLPVNVEVYFNTRSKPYEAIRKEMYIDVCKAYIQLFIPD